MHCIASFSAGRLGWECLAGSVISGLPSWLAGCISATAPLLAEWLAEWPRTRTGLNREGDNKAKHNKLTRQNTTNTTIKVDLKFSKEKIIKLNEIK